MNSVKQQQRNEDLYNETEAIKDLPKNLQDEIVKGINTKIFQKIVFFTQTFSKQTNEQLTNKMRKVVFNPNEIIFEQQKVDDQSIYLITNGIVELFYHNYKSQKVIANLQKNQYFGEISFFSGQSRSASARSLTFTTAYKISRQDFLDVIYSKQKDHERYKMIEEQILFQNNLKCIKVNCFGCQQIGHTVNQCPFLNPQFDKQASFLRYKFQHINQRKHFLRNTNKNSKNNTLLLKHFCKYNRMALKTNTEFAKKLQINLNIEQSFYSTEEENYDNDEFSLNPSKKMTENQLNNFNSNKSYDTLQFNEEYSPKLQKPKSTKSLCSKKYELNSADSQLQQCQLKDYEQNSLIANSFAGSPIFLPTNYQQDTQSEMQKH